MTHAPVDNTRWDLEADVVVAGFGMAGIGAALAAADAGAQVLILEKQPADRHTPTSKMGGSYFMTVTDADAATRYFDRCADGAIPTSVSRRWAQLASTLERWIQKLGTRLELKPAVGHLGTAAYPQFEGSEAIVTYNATCPESSGKVGVEFFNEMASAVLRRPNIRLRWSARGRRLAQDATGRIVGIQIDTPEGELRVGARRGVVLATGGFEFDEDLKRQYLRAYPVYGSGNPDNTGDGLRMALSVGADLWHMTTFEGRCVMHFEREDGPPVSVQPSFNPPGYLVTDKLGRRFSNEYRYTRVETYWYEVFLFDVERLEFSRIPFYWFFDQRRLTSGPITPTIIGQPAVGLYDWSRDNSAEVRRGWIKTGNSIEEVARLAGLEDPAAAACTVAAYNEACLHGEDKLGRPLASLVPLDRPPYCCVKLYPGGPGTAGGPRHDAQGRVLDPFGDPIPGLFAAGQVAQMIGTLYPSSGSGFSEALCAGIMAGTAAATEQ
jgi:succinate dehydrogenase/fumarate reductase flavoprotein subunit